MKLVEYNNGDSYCWIWRFLVTWGYGSGGWNGLNITLYDKECEIHLRQLEIKWN